MSSIEKISKLDLQLARTIQITRHIETHITDLLNATGKGLHEKLDSIAHLLPDNLIKRGRFIASVRNALMHEQKVMADGEFEDFLASANDFAKKIEQYTSSSLPLGNATTDGRLKTENYGAVKPQNIAKDPPNSNENNVSNRSAVSVKPAFFGVAIAIAFIGYTSKEPISTTIIVTIVFVAVFTLYWVARSLVIGVFKLAGFSKPSRDNTEHHAEIKEAGPRKDQKLEEDTVLTNGAVAYTSYREELARQAASRNPVVWIFFLIFSLMALASYYYELGVVMLVTPIVLALVSIKFLINPNHWLCSSKYYSFPGSRFQDGKHRCIFCGAKGIYRKGEYKTNNKYAYCSKCESPLFIE